MKSCVLLAIALVLTVAGCPQDSNQPSRLDSGRSKPPDGRSKSADERQDRWGILKAPTAMQSFTGSWEVDTFAHKGFDGTKTGAELREELRNKARLSREERQEKEVWYKLVLKIEQKSEPIGNLAPWNVDLIIETHKPDQPATTIEQSCEIRFRDKKTIELRSESLPRPDYIVTVVEDDTGTERLQIESNERIFDKTQMSRIQEGPKSVP